MVMRGAVVALSFFVFMLLLFPLLGVFLPGRSQQRLGIFFGAGKARRRVEQLDHRRVREPPTARLPNPCSVGVPRA